MDGKKLNRGRILCLLMLLPITAALLPIGACTSGASAKQDGVNLPPELAFYHAPPEGLQLAEGAGKAPRNIILMIGDGMGPNQVAMARHTGAGPEGRLWMETLPTAAKVQTDNRRGATTDSAAAVTAIACSVKTKNGMIGQTPDGRSWINIRERLQQEGYRSGLVATSAVTNATPAGFASHVRSRGMEDEIAEQMAGGGTDIILGGGLRFWQRPATLRAVERAGFHRLSSREDCLGADRLPVLGLFQDKQMTTWDPEPSIEEMTRTALRLLASPEADGSRPPFFLMVEGSLIDVACHAGDADAAVRQTLLFDMAVRAAIDFARQDGNTLLIVTADHETGGLTLELSGDETGGLDCRFTTSGHTSTEVPLFAFGPGADRFEGTLDNTDISKTIARLLGLDGFPEPLAAAGTGVAAMQTASP